MVYGLSAVPYLRSRTKNFSPYGTCQYRKLPALELFAVIRNARLGPISFYLPLLLEVNGERQGRGDGKDAPANVLLGAGNTGCPCAALIPYVIGDEEMGFHDLDQHRH